MNQGQLRQGFPLLNGTGRIMPVFVFIFPLFLLNACSQYLGLPPGEPFSASGSTGQVLIRIARTGAERTIYPEIPPFSRYILNFVHEDGTTAPDAVVQEAETIQIGLKTGLWTIIATAFIDPQSGLSLPVLQGSVRIAVEAGESASAAILLDKTLPGEGPAGRFTYSVTYPPDRVNSAVLSLSVLGTGGIFIPAETIDLRAGNPAGTPAGTPAETGSSGGSISLPAGYYRMDIILGTVYPFTGRTEIVHIYPGLETQAPPYVFTPSDFPLPAEITGTAALKEYLDSLPENTPQTPYPVKLKGVNLESTENTGETLRTLCAALSRFVALDLGDCTGTAIQSMAKNIAPNKIKIVSVILPQTVTSIGASGFSGYEALISAELPGVLSLNKSAFKDCISLESISMPELKDISDGSGSDSGVFLNCGALKSIFFPKAEIIGDYAFYKCDSLAAVSLPMASSIGKCAFRYAASLSAVSLPSAAFIGNYALSDCSRLNTLVLGAVPPALGGKNIFAKDMLPQKILVPAGSVAVYQNTTLDYWTGDLKERVGAAE
jgi:hypothetical protein